MSPSMAMLEKLMSLSRNVERDGSMVPKGIMRHAAEIAVVVLLPLGVYEAALTNGQHPGMNVCRRWLSNGECAALNICRYHHPIEHAKITRLVASLAAHRSHRLNQATDSPAGANPPLLKQVVEEVALQLMTLRAAIAQEVGGSSALAATVLNLEPTPRHEYESAAGMLQAGLRGREARKATHRRRGGNDAKEKAARSIQAGLRGQRARWNSNGCRYAALHGGVEDEEGGPGAKKISEWEADQLRQMQQHAAIIAEASRSLHEQLISSIILADCTPPRHQLRAMDTTMLEMIQEAEELSQNAMEALLSAEVQARDPHGSKGIQGTFEMLDSNHDGTIDIEEFVTWAQCRVSGGQLLDQAASVINGAMRGRAVRRQRSKTEQAAISLYDCLDLDGKGRVGLDTFREAIHAGRHIRAGPPYSQHLQRNAAEAAMVLQGLLQGRLARVQVWIKRRWGFRKQRLPETILDRTEESYGRLPLSFVHLEASSQRTRRQNNGIRRQLPGFA